MYVSFLSIEPNWKIRFGDIRYASEADDEKTNALASSYLSLMVSLARSVAYKFNAVFVDLNKTTLTPRPRQIKHAPNKKHLNHPRHLNQP